MGVQAVYDALTVTDAFGNKITRWGFFAHDGSKRHEMDSAPSKRKAESLIMPSTPNSKRPHTRRLSLGEFVTFEGSSSASSEA